MKNTLVTYVGISGSGKSRLTKDFQEEGFVIISPDALRKELTGDISNQSQNGRVFQTAMDDLCSNLIFNYNVVFDATNLKETSLRTLLKHAEFYKAKAIVYVMMDSLDVDLCLSRITKDLEDGVDRAKTNTREILGMQSEGFERMVTQGLDRLLLDYPEMTIVEVGHTN